MPQVPVKGGHRGCDLIVQHELGDNKLERSEKNGHKFFLSASFIDCVHLVTPVTEGWSVALSYYLVWEKPFIVSPHGMNLPTFISSLKTVEEILSPFLSPDEGCDAEMVVIPLTNDYARTPLNYNSLKGTDKLMANFLQSTDTLEIVLATVVNYRGGTAYSESRMNMERDESDGGFPSSPRQKELEDISCCKNYNSTPRRFIANLLSSSCSIEESFMLTGEEIDENSFIPIHWKSDYIFGNIESAKDLFDEVSRPDKEIYDRYYDVEDDLELQQWWFKPVLIFWPQNSITIDCRSDLKGVVSDLKAEVYHPNQTASDRQIQLGKFKKVVNYLMRNGDVTFHDDDDDEDEDEEYSLFIELLSICNLLKLKKEGILLGSIFAKNAKVLHSPDFTTEFSNFVELAGWDSCLTFFNSILDSSGFELPGRLVVIIFLIENLLQKNSTFCNYAATEAFRELYSTLFPATEEILSIEFFTSKLDSIPEGDDFHDYFLNVIFNLESRHLLENSELVRMVTLYLINKPITTNLSSIHHHFVIQVDFTYLTFEKISNHLQNLLVSLCDYFLQSNIHLFIYEPSPLHYVIAWIKLFVLVGRDSRTQELLDNIFPSSIAPEEVERKLIEFLKKILANEKFQSSNLKSVRAQLERTCAILEKRHRFDIRQSVLHLMALSSRLVHSSHPFSKASPSDHSHLRESLGLRLHMVIDQLRNPFNNTLQLSPEEVEKQFISLCHLLEVSNSLGSEEHAKRVIRRLLSTDVTKMKHWFRSKLLSAFAGFVSVEGWSLTIRKQLSSIKRQLDSKDYLSFSFLFVNELLKTKKQTCNKAAVEIFKRLKDDLIPQRVLTSSSLGNIDKQLQFKFYHLIFTMAHHGLMKLEDEIVNGAIRCLGLNPILNLHPFIEQLFSSPSLLVDFSLDQLTLRYQTLLGNFCSRFVGCIRVGHSIVDSNHLINWMKLFAYLENPNHLLSLMNYLCSDEFKEETNNISLWKLMATEEFQTDAQFKPIREHPILVEWKKRQQKESFRKLFSLREPAVSKKRKLTSQESINDESPNLKKDKSCSGRKTRL